MFRFTQRGKSSKIILIEIAYRINAAAGQIGICIGKPGHRTTLSFRTSPQTGVGISIELQATNRHTGRSILPFSDVHPRKVALLTGRLPRQESELARNDRKVGNPPNSNSSLRPVISLNHFIKPGIGCQPGSAS